MKSGWLAAGKYTKLFEQKFSDFFGYKKAVFTSSCTASLEIALMLANLERGDEVITTPLSYVATSNVILTLGLKVKFVDVDVRTGLLDPENVEKSLSSKTRAVIVVHLHGQMVDMIGFNKLAKKYDLKIIEDAAHCVEGERDGVRPGQLSFAAAFSFHAAKNLTSGQGGALLVDENFVDRAFLLRRDGVRNNEFDIRVMEDFGGKFDATDFQAALLVNQIDRIDKLHLRRHLILRRYQEICKHYKIEFFTSLVNIKHAAHMFVVNVNPEQRNLIRSELKSKGIMTSVHYNPIHLEPYYVKLFNLKRGDFPNSEKLGFSSVTLPLYPSLNKRQVNYIGNTLNEVLSKGVRKDWNSTEFNV